MVGIGVYITIGIILYGIGSLVVIGLAAKNNSWLSKSK